MKKFLQILSFIIPLIITIFVFMQFKEKENFVPITKEEIKIEDATKRQEAFKSWLDSKKNMLHENFYENLKLRRDQKEIKFSDLSETQKMLFKLLLFVKAKRDLENSAFANDLDANAKVLVSQTVDVANKNIDEQKKKIYNFYNGNIHPQDKIFLESIDVHLFK